MNAGINSAYSLSVHYNTFWTGLGLNLGFGEFGIGFES